MIIVDLLDTPYTEPAELASIVVPFGARGDLQAPNTRVAAATLQPIAVETAQPMLEIGR